MSDFWRPWVWMAACGFLLSLATLWRERAWRSRRGLCFAAMYLAGGYFGFAGILENWAWPKPILLDLPASVLNQHFGACLAAFFGFVAGLIYCEHNIPQRKDVCQCPTCGDDVWLLRGKNNRLEIHSMQDEMRKVAELRRAN